MRALVVALAVCVSGMAAGQGLDTSPRPVPNPRPAMAAMPETQLAKAPAAGPSARSPRPVLRPDALAGRVAAVETTASARAPDLLVAEPEDEVDVAAILPLTNREKRRRAREAASMAGAVCGVPAIKGEAIASIGSKISGCGVGEAVRVTSVSGVALSQAATVDCSVAKGLNTWVAEVAQPAFKGRLTELRIAAHYICRSRNNVRGAKVSEHGKGRAIDIAGFILADGTELTVAGDYNKLLRRIYKAACGIFTTTLGPGSDGYHEDHFHFDTAVRNSAYCR